MKKIRPVDGRNPVHPRGEYPIGGKSLPIRAIRVIRGFHSRF